MPPTSSFALDRKRFAALIAELYAQSESARFGVSRDDFEKHLGAVAGKYLSSGANEKEVTSFLSGLRIQELVLARACSAGNEVAWEVFLTRFREPLYNSGRAIAKDDATGRELADSLYADLYGMKSADGERRSKLDYYMGRGSLEGWLRTVLAQEYINRYRTQKRLVSLEEQEEAGQQYSAPAAEPEPAVDLRLQSSVDQALSSLTAEDRFLLASYYLDQRTLAEVGRAVGIHASNVSRRLEKLAAALREGIRNSLLKHGLDRRQAEELMDVDVRDLQVNIRARLAQNPSAKPFSDQKAGASSGEGES